MSKHIQSTYFYGLIGCLLMISTATSAEKKEEKPEEPTAPGSVMREEFTPGSWTLAILPDTQIYSQTYPGLFLMQTAWLAQNRDKFNMAFALHLGDITHRKTTAEWQNAQAAMQPLDGVLPYALAPGNHDYETRIPNTNDTRLNTRETRLNEFFPEAAARRQPTFGGVKEPGHMENSYSLFAAGGRQWIVIALEWAPRDETIDWANSIMDQHPDRYGILMTHAYLYFDDQRYDYSTWKTKQRWSPRDTQIPGSRNDGQDLWNKLVRKHNFVFVFSGHVIGDGTGYRTDKNDAGQTVHQILSNYQMRDFGGEAYMRLMEFLPDGKTVKVRSYSPLYDRLLTRNDQQFTVLLDD